MYTLWAQAPHSTIPSLPNAHMNNYTDVRRCVREIKKNKKEKIIKNKYLYIYTHMNMNMKPHRIHK